MKLTAEHWNNRYKTENTGWDIGYPSIPIQTYFDGLKDKSQSILIPGCGNAHEAEYLYKNGFKNVEVIDIAPLAIENFKKRVPGFPAEQIHCANFFEFTGQYDIIVEQTFFCAIDIDLRPNYAKKVYELLKPDGYLVGLLWNKAMRIEQPPYGGDEAEYRSLFAEMFHIEIMEDCYNSIKPRLGNELFVKLRKK